MLFFRAAVLAGCIAVASSASAQVTDPNMSCAEYLKISAAAGPTPKTGDATMDKMAAELETKMKDYCTKNPNTKAIEAAAKALGG